jgi:hypothetical protein
MAVARGVELFYLIVQHHGVVHLNTMRHARRPEQQSIHIIIEGGQS